MAKSDCITANNDNEPVCVERVTTTAFLKSAEQWRDLVAQCEAMLLEGVRPASVARWLNMPLRVVHSINRRVILACAVAMVVGGCAASVDDGPQWSVVVTRSA